MADYYYEARKHDKWLRKHAKENKVRRDPARYRWLCDASLMSHVHRPRGCICTCSRLKRSHATNTSSPRMQAVRIVRISAHLCGGPTSTQRPACIYDRKFEIILTISLIITPSRVAAVDPGDAARKHSLSSKCHQMTTRLPFSRQGGGGGKCDVSLSHACLSHVRLLTHATVRQLRMHGTIISIQASFHPPPFACTTPSRVTSTLSGTRNAI